MNIFNDPYQPSASTMSEIFAAERREQFGDDFDPWQEVSVTRKMNTQDALVEACAAIEQHARDCFGRIHCRPHDGENELHVTWYYEDPEDYRRWMRLRAAAGLPIHIHADWGVGPEVNIADWLEPLP